MPHAGVLLAGLLALGVSAAPAAAAARSWVGLAGGPSEADEFCDLFAPGIGCDDDDTGFKAFVGLQLGTHVGIEAFWADLGEVDARNAVGDKLAVSVDGVGVALLPTVPVSADFDLYGRFGVYAWDAEADLRIGGARSSGSDDGADPVLGLGARLRVNEAFAVRFEWEQFGVDDADVSLISAGAELRF